MCEQWEKSSIVDTLVRVSQLRWADIIAKSGKEGLGTEPIPQYRFKVELPLPKFVTPDVPIRVFRHSGGGRIAGVREGAIYHVLAVGEDLYSH
jgi:hypothetical protein